MPRVLVQDPFDLRQREQRRGDDAVATGHRSRAAGGLIPPAQAGAVVQDEAPHSMRADNAVVVECTQQLD